VFELNKHLTDYFHSFKLKKEQWYPFLVDSVFLFLFTWAVVFFSNLITSKAYLISQGKTADQLKQMLLSMEIDKATAFLSGLKSFFLTFIIGLIVIVIGSLLLFSLSRKLIWTYLLKKKTPYWKWNGLNLVLIIQVIIFLLIFGVLRILLGTIFTLFKSQIVLDIFYALFSLFTGIILVLYLFLVYFSFTEKYAVWNSIGQAFHLIKVKWSNLWPAFLLILATFGILSLLLWPLNYWLVSYKTLLLILNTLLTLFFLAWARVYWFHHIKE